MKNEEGRRIKKHEAKRTKNKERRMKNEGWGTKKQKTMNKKKNKERRRTKKHKDGRASEKLDEE